MTQPIALDHENWLPLSPSDIKHLFEPLRLPWWVAGGVALDLFLRRKAREHRDLDVAVLRKDQAAFQNHLHMWDMRVPTGHWEGEPQESRALFVPWEKGQWLGKDVSQAWMRRSLDAPWAFELLFADGDENEWKFKKDPSIAMPLDQVGRRDCAGVPYLVPEVVLLHKAGSATSGSGGDADADFANTTPSMSPHQIEWLFLALRSYMPEHPWVEALSTSLEESRSG